MPNDRGVNHLELIEALGGTRAVAELTGVKPPSVSEWKARARIPDDKLMRLAPLSEARGLASRKDLFPDDWHVIWPELIATEGAPDVPTSQEAA